MHDDKCVSSNQSNDLFLKLLGRKLLSRTIYIFTQIFFKRE